MAFKGVTLLLLAARLVQCLAQSSSACDLSLLINNDLLGKSDNSAIMLEY